MKVLLKDFTKITYFQSSGMNKCAMNTMQKLGFEEILMCFAERLKYELCSL